MPKPPSYCDPFSRRLSFSLLAFFPPPFREGEKERAERETMIESGKGRGCRDTDSRERRGCDAVRCQRRPSDTRQASHFDWVHIDFIGFCRNLHVSHTLSQCVRSFFWRLRSFLTWNLWPCSIIRKKRTIWAATISCIKISKTSFYPIHHNCLNKFRTTSIVFSHWQWLNGQMPLDRFSSGKFKVER